MNISLSPARLEDIEIIVKLNWQLVEEYEDLDSIDLPKIKSWIHKNIQTTLPHCHRILLDGDMAGYFSLVPGETRNELDSFFLFPKYQNKGVGTQILRECQSFSEKPIFLYVFRCNEKAISFYKRSGFRILQEASPTRYIMQYP